MTARELLDQGAARIERELATEPLVQARLLTAMGNAYRALGTYGQSAIVLEKALALRRRLLPVTHPDLIATLQSLGYTDLSRSDFVPAEKLFQEELAAQTRSRGAASIEAGTGFNDLSRLYFDWGDFSRARSYAEQGLAVFRRAPEDPGLLFALSQLQISTSALGRLREAEPLAREVVAARLRSPNYDPGELAINYSNLGFLQLKLGHYTEAGEAMRQSLSIREKTVGPDHPTTADVLGIMAVLLVYQGKYADAVLPGERSLRIREIKDGKDSPRRAYSLDPWRWHGLARAIWKRLKPWREIPSRLAAADRGTPRSGSPGWSEAAS